MCTCSRSRVAVANDRAHWRCKERGSFESLLSGVREAIVNRHSMRKKTEQTPSTQLEPARLEEELRGQPKFGRKSAMTMFELPRDHILVSSAVVQTTDNNSTTVKLSKSGQFLCNNGFHVTAIDSIDVVSRYRMRHAHTVTKWQPAKLIRTAPTRGQLEPERLNIYATSKCLPIALTWPACCLKPGSTRHALLESIVYTISLALTG